MEEKINQQPTTPAETPTKPVQHPINTQRRFFPVILGLFVLLVAVAVGTYYLGKQNNVVLNQVMNKETTPTTQPSPTTNSVNKVPKTERIVLQAGYYFDVTIPEDYSLKEGVGDYANYVVDADGKELIGFAKSSGGGELSKTYPIIINSVPLVVMYRKDVGCPADIFSKEYSVPLKMSFGIMTWCTDEKETQLPVYKQIIESIIFGPKLRDVLLGKEPVPSLQYTP